MRTYRPVQFVIRDRRALAGWIRRRIVARCPTVRAAVKECGLPVRLFYDLAYPKSHRRRVRISRHTFQCLIGAATRLNAGGAVGFARELLDGVLILPPGPPWWTRDRPHGNRGRRRRTQPEVDGAVALYRAERNARAGRLVAGTGRRPAELPRAAEFVLVIKDAKAKQLMHRYRNNLVWSKWPPHAGGMTKSYPGVPALVARIR